MDSSIDIQDFKARLNSGNLEVQTTALTEAGRLIQSVSEIAVLGFTHTDNPMIYADYLHSLGPAIIPYLESFYTSYEIGKAKTVLAILLLALGDRTGLSDVLGALTIEDENQFIAASRLANASIVEAIDPITSLIRTHASGSLLDPTLGPKLGTLIDALTKLGADMPVDLRQRLMAPEVPKYISAYLP